MKIVTLAVINKRDLMTFGILNHIEGYKNCDQKSHFLKFKMAE